MFLCSFQNKQLSLFVPLSYSLPNLSLLGVGNVVPDDDCNEGYYCPGGQTTSNPVGLECTIGHYCPEGSWEPMLCGNGTFNDQTMQSECEICPAGYYCDPYECKWKYTHQKKKVCNLKGLFLSIYKFVDKN